LADARKTVGRYIIILDRMDDDEAVGKDAHWPNNDREGMEQVAAELQEAMNVTGQPAGFFNVVARAEITSDEAVTRTKDEDEQRRSAITILSNFEPFEPKGRLEYLRAELRAERISYGELAELQSLAEHIEPGDVELLEAAGVPEHPPEMGDVFTIVVRSKDGRDLTPELASHPSIDGAADKARQGKPLGSLANLDADNALTAVCQIIDQGHEWTTGSEDVVQPLRDRMDKFINQEQGGLAECVTPDGWQVYVFRFNEEVQQ
jgi:hypothetical protein